MLGFVQVHCAVCASIYVQIVAWAAHFLDSRNDVDTATVKTATAYLLPGVCNRCA